MSQTKSDSIMSADQMIELFTFKILSGQSIEQIIKKVPEECSANQLSLLQTYVYHEIVESKGFPIQRKVYIYEICRAKIAAAMLTDFPHFSIFMPCKLSVYEDRGHTVISTMNMEMMLDAIRSNMELYQEASSLYNTVKSMMDTLSNN